MRSQECPHGPPELPCGPPSPLFQSWGLGVAVWRLVLKASSQKTRSLGALAGGGALPEKEKPLWQLQPLKKLPSFFPF